VPGGWARCLNMTVGNCCWRLGVIAACASAAAMSAVLCVVCVWSVVVCVATPCRSANMMSHVKWTDVTLQDRDRVLRAEGGEQG
jgi:hypothetical protein